MITYSLVIPHKNTPKLLQRCLESIPQREDVEVIVVDDNSDEHLKPYVNRHDVILLDIGSDWSKGAGRARNIGLSQAKGRWVLFADADDYYEKGHEILLYSENKEQWFELIEAEVFKIIIE